MSGIVISVLSLGFMFFLWYLKVHAAVVLDDAPLLADAACSLGCIQLSTVLFVGSVMFKIDDQLWWVDPVAALIICMFLGHEGYGVVRNALREDFEGSACACHDEHGHEADGGDGPGSKWKVSEKPRLGVRVKLARIATIIPPRHHLTPHHPTNPPPRHILPSHKLEIFNANRWLHDRIWARVRTAAGGLKLSEFPSVTKERAQIRYTESPTDLAAVAARGIPLTDVDAVQLMFVGRQHPSLTPPCLAPLHPTSPHPIVHPQL